MFPRLDEHLDIQVRPTTRERLADAVKILLEIDTCFAVIGGELEIRLHQRGWDALVDAGWTP